MSDWPSTRASRVLSALQRKGWEVKRQTDSHKVLSRKDWPNVVFAFRDHEELGPSMLARFAKQTGLSPEDL